MTTYTFQVISNEKPGGEQRTISKKLHSEEDAKDMAQYLMRCGGWTSVVWAKQQPA